MSETLSTASVATTRRPLWRRLLRVVLAITTTLICVSIVTLVAAQVIRDRNIWLALLMYIPLWPVAISAIAWDLILLGRALPLRFILLCVGLAMGMLSIGMMWSPPFAPQGDASRPTLKILQWNTQWGRNQQKLDEMVDQMKRHAPDVVCLAEAPAPGWIEGTWQRRAGDGWTMAFVNNPRPQSYWYRMMVMSRFPVHLVKEWPLQFGHAALFEVQSEPQPLRLMLVDMESWEFHPRTPGIRQAAQIIDDLALAGRPVDIVAGDFNAPARFIGFDALAGAGEGYTRGAMWSGQWRATWPAFLQYRGRQFNQTWRLSTLDIDHIFIRRKIDVAAAYIFNSTATDHRGQTVTIRLK